MKLRKLTAFALVCALPLAAGAKNSYGDDTRHSQATIDARSHYFGRENVNQRTGDVHRDKVIISWFSVSSYAVAAKGQVVLLDSYIYRLSDTPGYVPTTLQELVDLNPAAIFIGHGHGDHADNAAYIAVQTGARIFGASEHCDAMQGDAERIFGAGAAVDCTALTSPGSAPGAEVVEIFDLRPELCVTSFKHLHSGAAPLDPDFPQNLINPVRDPRVNDLYPPQPPPTLNTRTVAGAGGRVSMFYQFTVAGSSFSFIWHNTNGPVKDFEPHLLDMFRALPKADVEIGSLVSGGGGEAVNGVRDVAMYVEAIKPKVFYGGHSDNFNIGSSPYYHQALQRQFDIFAIPESERAEVRGLHDPYDYLRPGLATFDYKDRYWRATPPGKTAYHCPTGH